MTLIISHRHGGRIDIVSDGAVYDDAGVIHGAECKVVAMPGMPAVVSGSGKVGLVDAITERFFGIFQQAGSFDRAVVEVSAALCLLAPLVNAPPFRIVLAGMSEAEGPLVFLLGNTAEEGREPMVLYKAHHGTAMQHEMPAVMHREIVSQGGLRNIAVGFMEASRRDGWARGDLVVGCHVDFTTITASGVTTERIHEWPDTIGEKITMFDNSRIVPMNRQQCRAMERQNGKFN
ncbi:MAG TPA: hypothetical protein VGE05_15490 [Novosphingobium sp.]